MGRRGRLALLNTFLERKVGVQGLWNGTRGDVFRQLLPEGDRGEERKTSMARVFQWISLAFHIAFHIALTTKQ